MIIVRGANFYCYEAFCWRNKRGVVILRAAL